MWPQGQRPDRRLRGQSGCSPPPRVIEVPSFHQRHDQEGNCSPVSGSGDPGVHWRKPGEDERALPGGDHRSAPTGSRRPLRRVLSREKSLVVASLPLKTLPQSLRPAGRPAERPCRDMSFLYLTHFLLGKGDPNGHHTQTLAWCQPWLFYRQTRLLGKVPVKTSEAVLLIFPARSAASFWVSLWFCVM